MTVTSPSLSRSQGYGEVVDFSIVFLGRIEYNKYCHILVVTNCFKTAPFNQHFKEESSADRFNGAEKRLCHFPKHILTLKKEK